MTIIGEVEGIDQKKVWKPRVAEMHKLCVPPIFVDELGTIKGHQGFAG
jgi:hypothetical protein